jgi:hypothetical protein
MVRPIRFNPDELSYTRKELETGLYLISYYLVQLGCGR